MEESEEQISSLPPDDEPDAEAASVAPDEADEVARERDELLETVRRVQADFENYRKRMLREQTDQIARATEGLIERLLPALDAFELALVNMDDTRETEKVRKGVEMVFAEFLGALEKAGLERIEANGQPFDPDEHEAVMQIGGHFEGDDEPVVAETVRTGYRLKGRVLRPAMVKVARR